MTEFASSIYSYEPHPRIESRKAESPPKVVDERVGFNGKIGLLITTVVGTMWCAYLFTALALISLPAALQTHQKLIIIAWIAQTFLQLVLLPVIIVGQNIQAKASDKRADQTYRDAEAVLRECQEIQSHLLAQDRVLSDLLREAK